MSIENWDSYTIPTWAVCAIEYGDTDELSAEEADLIEEWLDTLPEGHIIYGWDFDNEFFSWHPEFGLATTCVECEVMYDPEERTMQWTEQ
jgi:hypothetical protein